MSKLSVIIVNYNVQFFLENCLHSVFNALKGIDGEVIVVDNNSVDGSLKMLEQKFPQVKLIANKNNLGFSKANNQAIKESKGEYVLLLNPDTVVEEDTFKICIDSFERDPKVGGIGVMMLDGKGNFLPESKRGLPTPAVAFYKIFGLSNLFPRSKRFSQYHLGHLSKDENHEIEILSGAFMMLRKTVIDQIGTLDENFFMYGEDIDLSYRITKAGYKNLYLADTSIIHYKGESTKKSSINYVYVFYRAMAIFAKKHFSQTNAKLFSFLINLAIYLRAALAVATRTAKHFILPLLDGTLLFIGIQAFKNYYEDSVKYVEGGSYPVEVESYGIPMIVLVYLFTLLLNGAYLIPTPFNSLVRGVFSGSLVTLIIYSLLDESFRFSRAIILFSILWSLFGVPAFRFLLHLLKFRKFKKAKDQRIAIIGKKDEIQRINSFLLDTPVEPQLIITINANNDKDGYDYTANLYQLEDILEIYSINEVIFCSKDVSSKEIIKQMGLIEDTEVDFKIAPPESLYIIGSNSIESSGEYYILGSNAILKPINQRNKRFLDICLSILFLLISPLMLLFIRSWTLYMSNMWKILRGKLSFVGFSRFFDDNDQALRIKIGVLNPSDLFERETLDEHTNEKLNFEYGRDYKVIKDLEIIFKNILKLGRKVK